MAELFRSVQFKVFAQDRGSETFVFHPDEGKLFTRESLKVSTENFLELLKAQFPGVEYKVVAVAENKFNILPQRAQA
jgi:hypothetical protein